jgi:Flp pilus assembly protein CpaB
MEMEFKDNSRRRTLVLVVGVLLALGAGAAAFMLSSQGTDEPVAVIPTNDIVVAAELIPARTAIGLTQVQVRSVPIDDTNAAAFTDRNAVVDQVTAIDILPLQPITRNMLASGSTLGTVPILKPTETIAPDSPVLRAVSLTIPANRAVAGLVAEGQRVDVIATLGASVTDLPLNLTATGGGGGQDPEAPPQLRLDISTKLAWTDVEVIKHDAGSDLYVFRVDLSQAEEIAHAQSYGAEFTMALRPDEDTRDIDRSFYGTTTARIFDRFNFPMPEVIGADTYPQPTPFPTPYPAEPYLTAAPEPSLAPGDAIIEIPIDTDPELIEPTPEP